ncbi:MAG: DUF4236 domain-containing protein [Solirubrobacterales bacterium]
MRKSFKVAPGVRVTASKRGLSSSFGPRAARVHVNSRGVGLSSGVGPVSTYTRFGTTQRRSPRGGSRTSSAPTKASIAAHERQLKAAQREADIDKVATLEKSLVGVHRQSFPDAERAVLPQPDSVDPGPVREALEKEAGIPALVSGLGGGDAPPVAPDPEPVDRYHLMREYRKRRREGIPFWQLRAQIDAAREADGEAEAAAEKEAEERRAAQAAAQVEVDRLWDELQQARATVAQRLPQEIAAEKGRRDAARTEEQQVLDAAWAKLQANDPEVTLPTLEEAFADNEAPAAAIDCEGDQTTVVMQFSAVEAIVPERKPARTPTGKRTLKKRTKTEVNALYLEALGSNVLATVKEAFAVAPGTETILILAIRRETDGKRSGELTAIYVGEFDRASYAGASGAREPAKVLIDATESQLNLKGKTAQVAPLDLEGSPDLKALLEELSTSLRG